MKLVGYTIQSADDGLGRCITLFKRRESAVEAINDMDAYLSGYSIVETEIDIIE